MPAGPIRRFWQKLREAVGESAVLRSERSYAAALAAISGMGKELAGANESELRERARGIRVAIQSRGNPAAHLVEWYALVREFAARQIGLRAHDEQILAAIALSERRLVEMPTGEGKTLVAVFPASLWGAGGEGVHVLTFNDYLARRDAEWMGPVYRTLGISVAAIQQGQGIEERRAAYGAGVTYATLKEVGFDFLRDRLALDLSGTAQRPFHLAIVDEADSLLIDEARVPLVIARSAEPPPLDPRFAAELVRGLRTRKDYQVHAHEHAVSLSDAGVRAIELRLRCPNLYAPENQPLLATIQLALRAEALLRRDVHYIVRDGRIEIVDEFTGRVVPDRRWPDGLQAAVEAKEGVEILPEGRIHGSITIQHLVDLYPRLGAMSATAQPAGEELEEIYGLKVVVVEPHRPCVRRDEPDLVFTHLEAKWNAVAAEIERAHRAGRPVLVGTRTILESESIGRRLTARGIPHRILNAKHDREEASIVASAGAPGAVTISTNLAGRGTDIRLGGPDESARDAVVALGGLYVIGTNRHESRRIDDQLRGRAGRQGDPGASRLFLSLEDDLLVRYGIRELLPPGFVPPPRAEPIEEPIVARKIAHAQRVIEGEHFEIRRMLRRYSTLVEEERREFHEERQAILFGEGSEVLLGAREQPLDGPSAARVLGLMDAIWAEHLAEVEALKDQVHLSAIANVEPLAAFQLAAGRAFIDLWNRLQESIESSEGPTELAAPAAPSSTWTYLLSDNPLGHSFDRAFAGIVAGLRRRLRETRSAGEPGS